MSAFDEMASGKIPWDADEMGEVVELVSSRLEKPKDDWDLGRRELHIHDGDEVSRLRLMMNNPMVQQDMLMVEHLKGKGHSPETIVAHCYRFHTAIGFIGENRERLLRDGMIVLSDEDSCDMLSPALFQALAILPFTGTDKTGHDEVPGYDYDEVLRVARDFDESQD